MDIDKMMRTGQGIEELENNLLNLDSEFRFKCRRCGKCCIHQDTILLNARDIFNIAKKEGRTMRDVVESYTEVYIGKHSRIPVVHLISNGPKDACPLLKDGRCSVHECKPTVCALYPLGRVSKFNAESKPFDMDAEIEIGYIINEFTCGSAKRVNTVRSWLARFGIPERDEFYILWSRLTFSLGYTVREMEKRNAPEGALNTIWNTIFTALYLEYDMEQDFMPQFTDRAEKLIEVCKSLCKALEEGLLDDAGDKEPSADKVG